MNSTISNKLTEIRAELQNANLQNKDEIIPLGIKAEKLLAEFNDDQISKQMMGAVKNILIFLQKIYKDEIKNIQQAQQSLIKFVAKLVDVSETDNADLLGKLLEISRELLNDKFDAIDELVNVQSEVCELSLQDIAAKFMLLDSTDTSEINCIKKSLTDISVSDNARKYINLCLDFLSKIEPGKEADILLEKAGSELDSAIQIENQLANYSSLDSVAESENKSQPVSEQAEESSVSDTNSADAEKSGSVTFDTPCVLSEDVDFDILSEYIQECTDHITSAEGALLDLESDPTVKDHIDVVFRSFHTIKGTSGFLNLDRIQKLAHLAENMLDRARDGEIQITGGYADLALRSCDCLRNMIENLNGLEPGDALFIPEDFQELLDILINPEAAGYSENDASTDGSMRVGDILVAQNKVSRSKVESVAQKQGEESIGKALVKSGAVKPEEVANAVRIQKNANTGATSEGSIRVGVSRLDNLINMVGELVIAQSMVTQDPSIAEADNTRLRRNVLHAGKIIRELQDLTMGLRMVPLKGVFQKMNRLVRDLAKKCGKQVQFSFEGEETEIDRNMVESLNDPLVHMVRNSMDHGVETPDKRQTVGKNPQGKVTLKAYHAGGNVVIELEDDGNGLDRDVILKKAIEKGVVEPGRDLSDSEIFMLIFAPGFSTAEKITDVSGRGVGMDVVKRNIESLQGRIEVESTLGKGTKFTIKLPLTMAITDAMILRVGHDRYLLPTISIEQSFQPDEESLSTYAGAGEMVMLRGELLPIARLHQLFNISDSIREPHNGLLVVIESAGKRCALMVDELLGQQQVVVKSLGSDMTKIPGISGGAILGDGSVGLILDATGLMQIVESSVYDDALMSALV